MPSWCAAFGDVIATGCPSIVGLDDPGEALHQGRLAGAVVADQTEHITAAHRERHAAEGVNRAVRLGDVAHCELGVGRRLGEARHHDPGGHRGAPVPVTVTGA
jgi:2-keto-4-pentenoate hydratase/2-oxohepta-3-ene-1,7-dioic acid hydratase in catechol pathway